MVVLCQGVDGGDWIGTVKCVQRYPLTNSGRVVEALAHRSMREAVGSEPHKKSAIDTDARATFTCG